MAKNVQLTVDIKGGDSVGKAAEKTKTLKQELRELKNELASGSLTGKAFDEATARAGKLSDTIIDVNNRVKALATDGPDVVLKGFGDMATGIVGGFAAAQGAMALFGSENEDLQKTLVKLQGATALLNGLQQVNATLQGDSAAMVALNTAKTKVLTFVQTRYAAAVGTSTGALKLMRIAGAALGIGLIVTAIGLLIANFDKVKKAVLNFIPALANVGELFNNVKNAIMDFLGMSSEMERQLEKQTKANEKSNKETEREIALLESLGGKEREIFILRNRQLRQDEALLLTKQKKIGLTKEETEALADLQNQIKITNNEEVNRQKEIQDNQAKEAQELDKKRKEKAKKDEEDAAKNKKDALKRAKDLRNDVIKDFEERQKILKEKKKEQDDLNEELEDIAFEAQLKRDEEKREKIKEEDEKRIQDQETYKEQTLAVTQSIEDSKVAIAQQGAQLLNQVAGQSKGLALAALAIEKGSAIASVIINTQRSIIAYRAAAAARSALTAGATTIADNALAAKQITLAKIGAGISIASISAAGLSGAKNITSGGSGGSGGGGSVQPPNIRGSQTTNEPTSQPATKVFVTETDIRSSLRKVDGIYTQSTIQ
jgi:hypothetical protein